MTGIILAAGSGRRLGINKPKGLLNIYGKPLIEYSIDNLLRAGVNKIVICTGYRHDMYETYVEKLHERNEEKYGGVECVLNPEYAACGSLYSLQVALESLEHLDDIVLLDSDIIYNFDEFLEFMQNGLANSVLCTNVPKERYDACFIKMDMHKLLVAISKNERYAEPYNDTYYEYIGITKFSGSQISKILEYSTEKFESTGSIDHEYDYAFETIDTPFHCDLINDYIWTESDDDTQLRHMIVDVYPKLNLSL